MFSFQGGPGPHCFSGAFADILVYNEVKCHTDLSEIHDADILEHLTAVSRNFCFTCTFM